VLTFGEVLDTCRRVSASESFLIENQVANWEALPLWLPSTEPDIAGFYSSDCTKAIAAGLTFRPFAQTVRDTLAWDRDREGDLKIGLKRDREASLIARLQE
jgi:2'-hydroxyisoflavone reductase